MKFPPGMPPELQAYLTEISDRQDMASAEWVHRVSNFIEGLNVEQISVLKIMFHGLTVCTCGTGKHAAYYEGLLDAMGAAKFDICMGCGENHLESIQKLNEASEPNPHVDENAGKSGEEIDEADLMKLYEVKKVHDAGDVVQCVNCGYVYPSLKDRMMKDPGMENCPGCVEKTKWG